MKNKCTELIESFLQGQDINHENILYILDNMDKQSEEILFNNAYKVRNKYYGRKVFVRGLIEFSNYCKCNCNYCGLRRDKKIERYRLSPETIIEQCKRAYAFGYHTFVLQSGEDPWYTTDILLEIIKGIKDNCPDAALTLSIGERGEDEYQAFRQAGVDRYLLRHEAINLSLYRTMHPDMVYEHRIQRLYQLKNMGYQTGAGFMVGVKGQNIHHIAEDLFFLHQFQPDMIGIGPFLPSDETPFSKEPPGDINLTLRCMALARILVPKSLIPLTTALVSLSPTIQEIGFTVGANVIMPNITPCEAGERYRLYENKNFVNGLDPIEFKDLKQKMIKIGFPLDMSRGDVCEQVPKSQVES